MGLEPEKTEGVELKDEQPEVIDQLRSKTPELASLETQKTPRIEQRNNETPVMELKKEEPQLLVLEKQEIPLTESQPKHVSVSQTQNEIETNLSHSARAEPEPIPKKASNLTFLRNKVSSCIGTMKKNCSASLTKK